MNTTTAVAADRFMVQIKIALELGRTHDFLYVAAFLLDYGPSIDAAFHTHMRRIENSKGDNIENSSGPGALD